MLPPAALPAHSPKRASESRAETADKAYPCAPSRSAGTSTGRNDVRAGSGGHIPTRTSSGRTNIRQPRGRTRASGRRRAKTKYGNVSRDIIAIFTRYPTGPFIPAFLSRPSVKRYVGGSGGKYSPKGSPHFFLQSEPSCRSARTTAGNVMFRSSRRQDDSVLRPSRYILNEMPPTKLTSSVAGFQIRLVKNPSFMPLAPLISQLLPAFRKTFWT